MPSSVSAQQTTSNPVQLEPTSTLPSSSVTSIVSTTTDIPSTSTVTSTSPYFNSLDATSIPSKFSSTPLPSSNSTLQTTTTPPLAGGLSGGGIAGIAVASIIVGVAFFAFCVWKIYLRPRDRQQTSLIDPYAFGAGNPRASKSGPDFSEKSIANGNGAQRASTISPFEAHGQSVYVTPSAVLGSSGSQPSTPISHVSYAVPALPPTSYNNPGNLATLAAARASVGPGVNLNSAALAAGIQEPQIPVATIKCTFVPTLPDELSITTGERVRLIDRFDDGWALCENGGGEQGMVPQECLEQITVDPGDADWRNAKRVSSLNPDGRR
ncbi:hypothetical protein J3A83DRAFT_4096737 [Scleroderma citrinum]